MEELKRQLIEAVAALDAHDAETVRIAPMDYSSWRQQNEQRSRLVYALAGVARCVVNQWKAEDSATPCGAEFAGHVCGTKGAHVVHEDARTGQRWPVAP